VAHHREVAAAGEGEDDSLDLPGHGNDELLEHLSRTVQAADAILARLAADMRDAGASMATERAERARAELRFAAAAAAELQRRNRLRPPAE
jgi:hypothetical protein